MNILAIESSCDETAAAVVRDGRTVLSNCVASQIEMHTIYGGVVPEIASRKHVEAVSGLAREALERAGLSREEVDGVAVTYAPGLIGAVLVGVNFAKGAALALDRPLIPVHHVRGHIAANYLTHPDLEPPFVCLCVSGGTTAIVDVRSYTEMEVLGGTRDDAAGECFDKVARVLGIGYPGGAPMDRLADGGDDAKYELPRAHVQGAELDMSPGPWRPPAGRDTAGWRWPEGWRPTAASGPTWRLPAGRAVTASSSRSSNTAATTLP